MAGQGGSTCTALPYVLGTSGRIGRCVVLGGLMGDGVGLGGVGYGLGVGGATPAHLPADVGGPHKDEFADVRGGHQRIARLAVAGHDLEGEQGGRARWVPGGRQSMPSMPSGLAWPCKQRTDCLFMRPTVSLALVPPAAAPTCTRSAGAPAAASAASMMRL